MLEPTATAAKSVADNRPAMIVSIVAVTDNRRLAIKSGQPSLTKARSKCRGAAMLCLLRIVQVAWGGLGIVVSLGPRGRVRHRSGTTP